MDSKDLPKDSGHEDMLRIPWFQDLVRHAVPLSLEGSTPGAGDQNIVNNGNFSSM